MYSIGAWGFNSFNKLNQLNECLGVSILHKLVLITHVQSLAIWVFRRIKIPMITLYELIDFTAVIRIKMFALHAEVAFDRFCKELHFICLCPGDFVIMAQCQVITLTLWLILYQDSLGSVSKLIELQNFSQLACVFT